MKENSISNLQTRIKGGPKPLIRHIRRKSDTIYNKDAYINPQISTNRLNNPVNVCKTSLIRNTSIRSTSIENKNKVCLDLSKIRHTKNTGSLNFSARNSDYHQKFSHIYLRKKSTDHIITKQYTERLIKKETTQALESIAVPDIEILGCNRFIERLNRFEPKLSQFYSSKLQ